MNSETNRDQSGESNAGAAMNDNSSALQKGVRKNASHPGDASNAAGMHATRPEDGAGEGSSGMQSDDESNRQESGQ